MALRKGLRGLPGGSSLSRLLAEHRGVRNKAEFPPLNAKRILAWADAHHSRTGGWPNAGSGPISEAPGETWNAVESALNQGLRGSRWRFVTHPTPRQAARDQESSPSPAVVNPSDPGLG